MSKTYALAVMLAGTLVFSCLFYLQHQVLTTQHEKTFVYAEAVQQRVIKLKRAQLDELVRKTKTVLQDETKERFRPIGPFMKLAREGEGDLIDAAESLEQGNIAELKRLLQLRAGLLVMLHDSAVGLLKAHGHRMDLNPDDIEAKADHLRKIVDKASIPPVNDFTEPSFSLQRDLMVLDYLNVLEEVLLDITRVSGGITLNCFPPPDYFPVINHGFSDPKLGESITTSISVGKLDHTLLPKNMFVLINGDTLAMNRNWIEPYTFKPKRRGKQVLEMELYVRNPLTGYVHLEGRNHYSFYVR